MKMYYPSLENNNLLYNLENDYDLCKILVYMSTFKNCETIVVTSHPHCIEIRGDNELVFIVLYVGFETNEFLTYSSFANAHFISFSQSVFRMVEFHSIKNKIKFIHPKALFFTALELIEPPVFTGIAFLLTF